MPFASSKVVLNDADKLVNTDGLSCEVEVTSEFEQRLKSDWFNQFNLEFNNCSFEYLFKQNDQGLSYPMHYDDLKRTS